MLYIFTYTKEISEDEIIAYGKKLEGKMLKDIGEDEEVNKWLNKTANKGAIGNAIQVCYFGIPANSIKDADFHYHHLELKVTPIKKNKNGTLSSKERLVLSIINYDMDWQYEFDVSPFLNKSNQMLLVFYLHEEEKSAQNYKILKVEKFTIPIEDLPTIREDYQIIIDKIKAGEAHQISESDTTYLAACTKGAGKGKDWRIQPFSNEKAKQRAFSFKGSYMTTYFNSIFNKDLLEKMQMPKRLSLTEFVKQTIAPYIGLEIKQIETKLNYHPSKGMLDDKGYLQRLVSQIFGIPNTELNKIEQFQKANIKFKTIRLREKNNQDMSFPNINFHEILNVNFEDSSWHEWFAETKYLFLVFEDTPNGTILKNQLFWNLPYEQLQELEKLYNHIKGQLIDGSIEINIVNNKSGTEIWKNNLPKKGFVANFQIRPKGNKESKFTTLPDGRKFKKMCLFLNKEYLHSLLKEN